LTQRKLLCYSWKQHLYQVLNDEVFLCVQKAYEVTARALLFKVLAITHAVKPYDENQQHPVGMMV